MSQKKSRLKSSIQYSDPGKILELITNLTDDNSALLQIKLNQYLYEECEAELVFHVIVQSDRMEASIDTVGNTALKKKEKLSLSQKLSDSVKGCSENSELLCNMPSDFQAIVNPFTSKDSTRKRLLMVPVTGKPFSLIVCVFAPKVMEEKVELLVNECYLFCWTILKKSISLEYECTLKQKCQQLLRIARRLFTQVATLDTLLQIAADQAKQLVKAEHCLVRLVDVDKMELVESAQPGRDDSEERRFPMDAGIAGLTLKTGNLINVKSAKDHPAFIEEVDSIPGIETKALLCFPIREQSGLIGVGVLLNKAGEPYFDALDEETILAFSVYCGLCLTHSLLYQRVREAHVRSSLANELVMYHMKVSDSEVSKVLACTGFHTHPHFCSLHFNIRALPARELPCYALKIFQDLGLDKKFQLRDAKLVRFVLHVKKGYRDVPYHNWAHAFSVAQWASAALLNYRLVANGFVTDLQALMFVIAALTHDLDHRGTTNSFQIQGQTTLAALYSSEGSVMERHHLAQAMSLLNSEGCDLLASLPRRDYDRALLMLRDFILATDLTNYFKNLNEYKAISMDFQKGNRLHSNALQMLLMNAADLSDQLKDWGSVKKTASAVLTEFFKQGDAEKSRGDLPNITFDRDKCFIPDLEIQFLNVMCIPLFELLGRILPKAALCVKIIENHIERWDAARDVFAEIPIMAGLSVLLSPELDNLIEHNLQEKERLRTEAQATQETND